MSSRLGLAGIRLRVALLLILPSLALAALYARALDYELVWTDSSAIGERSMLRPAGEWLEAFREPVHRVSYRGEAARQSYYRPFAVIWLSALDRAFGSAPRIFRLGGLVVAGLCTVLFALLAWRLLGRIGPALFAALFVAVHPVGIESYVWIAGIAGPLCALFTLAAFGLALASWREPRSVRAALLGAVSLAALLGALLSKERALAEPGLLFAGLVSAACIERLRPAAGARRRAAALLGSHALVVVGFFLAWRPAVLGEVLTRLPPIGASSATQLLSALGSWPRTLGWLFLPLASTTNDGVRIVTSPDDPGVWLGVLLVAGSGAAWAALLRSGRPIAALGLAWIWVAFLPTAGLVPILHARGERYLLLSAFGAALLLADLGPALLARIAPGRRRALAPLLALALLGFLAQRTWARLPAWQSTLTLFAIEVERDPGYREGRFLLAAELAEQGRHAEAERHLGSLLEAGRERRASSYLNLLAFRELQCANELGLGRHRSVLGLEKRVGGAVASTPAFQVCVGQAHEGLGHVREALEYYLAAARALEEATPPLLSLTIARASAALGRGGEALQWLDRANRDAAGDAALRREIGRLRATLGP